MKTKENSSVREKTRKIDSRKEHIRKTNMTSIVAANCDCEQYKKAETTTMIESCHTSFESNELARKENRSPTRSTDNSSIRTFLQRCCNRFYIQKKFYFGVRAMEITQK